jgi:hypothetical protein
MGIESGSKVHEFEPNMYQSPLQLVSTLDDIIDQIHRTWR